MQNDILGFDNELAPLLDTTPAQILKCIKEDLYRICQKCSYIIYRGKHTFSLYYVITPVYINYRWGHQLSCLYLDTILHEL